MPPRTYKKKNRGKKRTNVYRKRRVVRARKGLGLTSMHFKRDVSSILDFGNADSRTALNWVMTADNEGAVSTMLFQLNKIGDTTDFSNLFKYYKINKVVVKYIPLFSENTPVMSKSVTDYQTYHGQNLWLQWRLNRNGTELTAGDTQNHWDQIMAKKTQIFNTVKQKMKTFKIYPRVNRLTGPRLTPDNTLGYPGWYDTDNLDVPHFGLDVRLGYVDAITDISGSVTRAPIKFRVIHTYYFTCKGVH